jgi:hypothetical protein
MGGFRAGGHVDGPGRKEQLWLRRSAEKAATV